MTIFALFIIFSEIKLFLSSRYLGNVSLSATYHKLSLRTFFEASSHSFACAVNFIARRDLFLWNLFTFFFFVLTCWRHTLDGFQTKKISQIFFTKFFCSLRNFTFSPIEIRSSNAINQSKKCFQSATINFLRHQYSLKNSLHIFLRLFIALLWP